MLNLGAHPDAREIVRFCGIHSPQIITTAQGAFYLDFHADSGVNTHDGFLLNYNVFKGSKALVLSSFGKKTPQKCLICCPSLVMINYMRFYLQKNMMVASMCQCCLRITCIK